MYTVDIWQEYIWYRFCRGRQAVLVSKDGVELENGLFFLRGKFPSLDI
jgi:hypothetical protein